MGISKIEFDKEKMILSKVKDLLGSTLEELGQDVYQDEEDFTEFKKMMWENSSSFDSGEREQVMAATDQEAERILQKRAYFKICTKTNSHNKNNYHKYDIYYLINRFKHKFAVFTY